MTRRRPLFLAALFVSLLAFAAPAQGAVENHPFLLEAGAFTNPTTLELEYPEGACGVALNSSGDIYLSDYYHDQILLFNPEGEYLSKMGGEEPLDGPCGLAFDAAGDLYVNNFHRNVVKYPAGSLSAAAATVIDSGHPTGVAVEASTGEVYVDDRTYVAVYEPSGAPVLSGGEPLKIGLGTLGDGYGVAVSGFAATAGYVYVPDAATGTVKVYDPATSATSPVAEIDGQGTPQAGFNDLFDAALAVDDSDGHLFVVDNISGPYYEHPRAALDEFNAAGEYRGGLPESPLLLHGEPSGVAVDSTSGKVYVTSGNSEGSRVFVYGPTAPAYLLQVAKSGAGAGTVRSEPAGIRCGGACAAEFTAGAQVTITANPAAGSALAGWSVNGSSATCPGTGACQVTISAATEAVAEFDAVPAAPAATLGARPAAAAASGGSAGPEQPAPRRSVAIRKRRHRARHRHRRHRRRR